MCDCVCQGAHVKVRGQLAPNSELVLSFHYVGSRDQTQAVNGKPLYLLDYPDGLYLLLTQERHYHSHIG